VAHGRVTEPTLLGQDESWPPVPPQAHIPRLDKPRHQRLRAITAETDFVTAALRATALAAQDAIAAGNTRQAGLAMQHVAALKAKLRALTQEWRTLADNTAGQRTDGA
jgi:hypothetical protein